MTLENQKKLSKHICRLLKVSEVQYPIGRTPKGNLGVTFNVNTNEYEIVLDSIPLSTKSLLEDENNIELKKMIEKYYFTQENTALNTSFPSATSDFLESLEEHNIFEPVSHAKNATEKRKPGRPKKAHVKETKTNA